MPADGTQVTQVKREVLHREAQEFPRYDERRSGNDYRYLYTVGADLNRQGKGQPLYCHDLQTRTCEQHDYGANKLPGEVVFVPRNAEGDERDGWLLTYVYDLKNASSELVVLNAADVGGEPQAVIPLPVRVPAGFHANWLPAPVE